ncbi:MAG: UDP-glucose 4-epimerase GalE [Lachnospiraceae bacterium]|nr:UDP-glucose 4-epimerase GalE [Lachnospiraceae bacterium]
MSKILLTGGTGFIGSHTAVELLDKGYEVVIADNLFNSSADVIDRIEHISGKRPLFYQLDVADGAALRQLFKEQTIDAVIHFAGYKAVGESVAKPLMYYRNNLDSTLTLLEVMAEVGCSRIIFSSSATVYGASQPPFREDMPAGGCSNPYGWTKYMIEVILQDAARAKEQLSVVLLRYFNPVGAHASGLIGEKPSGIPNNLMPYITQVAAGKRDHLNVFGNDYETPDGTGVRDYIHVVDLAKGHVAALAYALEHTGTEIFNLGTGKGSSVLEMIQAFEEANHLTIPYEIAPRRPGDLAFSYAETDKAERLLGWKAEKNLEDMCRDAWRFEKNLLESI